jgi:hypothetical protein
MTATPDDETYNGDRSRRLLETLGGILAIAGVLLPVTGFAARVAAFSTLRLNSDSQWPLLLAWSAPIPELVLWGFIGSVIALAVLGYFYFATGLLVHPRLRTEPEPSREATRITRGVAIGLLIAWLVFVPGFPALWIAIPAAFAVSIFTRRAVSQGQKLRLIELWLVLALFLFVGGIVLGLSGVVPERAVADYRFKDEVHPVVGDGPYDRIGEASPLVFLSRCGTGGLIVMVNENELLLVTPVASAGQGFGPSLFDVMVNHRSISLGYQPC